MIGPNLSQVQRWATRVMITLDQRKAIEAEIRDFKMSFMSQDPVEMAPHLFPEFFEPQEVDSLDDIPEGAGAIFENTISDSEVEQYLEMMGIKR